MFSYRDTLSFGLTGDYDTVPDLQVLAEGIAESMAELLRDAARAG
jgi:diacylglycerol O-acyltransferase